MILDGASTAIHRHPEHMANDARQLVHLLRPQPACRHARMQSCPKQRFIDIDVAKTGRDRLVQQSGLQRTPRVLQPPMQVFGLDRERIRTQPVPTGMAKRRHAGVGLKPSESARITMPQLQHLTIARLQSPSRMHMPLVWHQINGHQEIGRAHV